MSDRTFRLILDGKKGGLVKGSSPSSVAKKACKKLSAEQMKNSSVFHQLSLKDKVLKTELGKISFKLELQETTKGSKKKVYGPYKIKVKMAGGGLPERTTPFNSFLNKNNREYKKLLKIREFANSWNNVEKILEKNDGYSSNKLKKLRNRLSNKNKNTYDEPYIIELFEYYKKHKAELSN